MINAFSIARWDFSELLESELSGFAAVCQKLCVHGNLSFPGGCLRMSSPSEGSQYKCTELSYLRMEGQNTLWTSSLNWLPRGRQRMFCNSDIFQFWANTLYLSAVSIRDFLSTCWKELMDTCTSFHCCKDVFMLIFYSEYLYLKITIKSLTVTFEISHLPAMRLFISFGIICVSQILKSQVFK